MNEKWARILGLIAVGVSAGLDAVVKELQAERRIHTIRSAEEPVRNTTGWGAAG